MSESSSLVATETNENQALPLSANQIARLSQALDNTDNDTLHTTLKKPASRFEVLAGTPISAMTESTIISDLPGTVTARVTQNVYDSVTGRYLLIPQGTKIILQYDNHVNTGQNRVFVTAKRLLFPNGTSMDLDGMPSNDTDGSSGFRDKTDNHYGRTVGGAALMGLLSASFQLSQPQEVSALQAPSAGQILAGSIGQQLADVSTSTLNKSLTLAPTLKIRAGFLFSINVTKDMVFPGSYTEEEKVS